MPRQLVQKRMTLSDLEWQLNSPEHQSAQMSEIKNVG